MKVIEPTAEVWKQNEGIDGIWEHIARCTRVCYQSQPRTEESAKDFVYRTILSNKDMNKNHTAMLEHGTVYLTIPTYVYDELDMVSKYGINNYSKVVFGTESYITTNMRVLVENNWLDGLKYLSKPTEYHVKRYTACFTTNIGVSREFNRHRVNSISEESTRYCNYAHPKFGNGINISKASDDFCNLSRDYYNTKDWIGYMDRILNRENPNMSAVDWYIFGLLTCEQVYLNMINLGAKPNQARRILPLATKTQLVHTAFLDDWRHFFDLRVAGISGTPHPDAKEVASKLLNEFMRENLL